MAAVGVILTLLLTGTTLNVQSYIGCIMLGEYRRQQCYFAGRPSGAALFVRGIRWMRLS
ncbi:MAG: hypothetical protein R3C68_13250 [Myxococcota bacterium]